MRLVDVAITGSDSLQRSKKRSNILLFVFEQGFKLKTAHLTCRQLFWPEMIGPTKGDKLCNVITNNVIWTNQKT